MARALVKNINQDSAPIGSIKAFAGSNVPAGWLLCDGRELNAVANPAYEPLWNVIGTTWPGSSSKSSFKIPNLAGRYLRGAGAPGDGNGGDTVALGTFAEDKTAQNGITIAGGTASLSGSAAPSTHSHGLSSGYAGINFGGSGIIYQTRHANSFAIERASTTAIGINVPGGSTPGTALFGTTNNYSGTTVTLSNTAAYVSASDTETRPHSYAVNYIIKY